MSTDNPLDARNELPAFDSDGLMKVSACRNDGGVIYIDRIGMWRHAKPTPSGYRAVVCRLAYPELDEIDVSAVATPPEAWRESERAT